MTQPERPKPPKAPPPQGQAPLGIDAAVREMAEAAARGAGASLNDWLNSTIGTFAAFGLLAQLDQTRRSLPDVSNVLADIQRRRNALAHGIEESGKPSALAAAASEQLANLQKSIDALRKFERSGMTDALVAITSAPSVRPNVTPQSAVAASAASPGWLKDLLDRAEPAPVREESERLRDITDLLGGRKVIGKYPADPLAAHEMLQRGLPNTAVKHLLDGMTTLSQKSIEGALGMSERTRQRREKHPTELLSQDQAGRTWKFAEVLTRAISVFGSRTAAEQWLAQPATGLEQRRPIDLLTTPAGVELVEEFLGRIEYGVYT